MNYNTIFGSPNDISPITSTPKFFAHTISVSNNLTLSSSCVFLTFSIFDFFCFCIFHIMVIVSTFCNYFETLKNFSFGIKDAAIVPTSGVALICWRQLTLSKGVTFKIHCNSRFLTYIVILIQSMMYTSHFILF